MQNIEKNNFFIVLQHIFYKQLIFNNVLRLAEIWKKIEKHIKILRIEFHREEDGDTLRSTKIIKIMQSRWAASIDSCRVLHLYELVNVNIQFQII